MAIDYRTDIKTVGIVGGGVIGAGWAARCLARGLDVVASDPAPGAEERLRAAVDNAWPALTRLGLWPGADRGRLSFEADLATVAARADFVQESAPEREDLKRRLLAEIDRHAPPDVVIGSSTSYLMPSKLQADCAQPERLVVGHPFNPVYLLPLVEVVGGERTDPDALAAAQRIYAGLGMHPLLLRKEIDGFIADRLMEAVFRESLLRKEIDGFIADRLMEAVFRESLHLLDQDVASTGEIDEAIIYGFGLRWAFMGVFLTFHLAGGDQGMRHFLEQFGPSLKMPYCRMEAPELSGELIDKIVTGCELQAAGGSVKELERLRNDCLISIMQALQAYEVGAGQVLAREDAKRGRAEA
jgi:carnitine 3-dehydrogenase